MKKEIGKIENINNPNIESKKSSKKTIFIIISIVIGILIVGGIVLLIVKSSDKVDIDSPGIVGEKTKSLGLGSNWQTYELPLGFQVDYPEDWDVYEVETPEGFIIGIVYIYPDNLRIDKSERPTSITDKIYGGDQYIFIGIVPKFGDYESDENIIDKKLIIESLNSEESPPERFELIEKKLIKIDGNDATYSVGYDPINKVYSTKIIFIADSPKELYKYPFATIMGFEIEYVASDEFYSEELIESIVDTFKGRNK